MKSTPTAPRQFNKGLLWPIIYSKGTKIFESIVKIITTLTTEMDIKSEISKRCSAKPFCQQCLSDKRHIGLTFIELLKKGTYNVQFSRMRISWLDCKPRIMHEVGWSRLLEEMKYAQRDRKQKIVLGKGNCDVSKACKWGPPLLASSLVNLPFHFRRPLICFYHLQLMVSPKCSATAELWGR